MVHGRPIVLVESLGLREFLLIRVQNQILPFGVGLEGPQRNSVKFLCGSLEDIAQKVAGDFRLRWHMASEFRYENKLPVYLEVVFPPAKARPIASWRQALRHRSKNPTARMTLFHLGWCRLSQSVSIKAQPVKTPGRQRGTPIEENLPESISAIS